MKVHVEQLKLCRASREELRERRRLNRQRIREQRPRFRESEEDEETDSSDTASEDGKEKPRGEYAPLYSYAQDERRDTTGINRRDSTFAPAEGRHDAVQASDDDTPVPDALESGERSTDGQGYSLRPRVQRNYKE